MVRGRVSAAADFEADSRGRPMGRDRARRPTGRSVGYSQSLRACDFNPVAAGSPTVRQVKPMRRHKEIDGFAYGAHTRNIYAKFTFVSVINGHGKILS